MRAKFRCEEITENSPESVNVKLTAVTGGSDENMDFNKYTPAGNLEMLIDNPDALGFFESGKEYYLDIKEAE